MGDIDYFAAKFSFAPRYFSDGFKRKLAKDLFQAKMGYPSDYYLSLSFGIASICFVFSLAMLSASLEYLPFSMLVFVVAFFSMTSYPGLRKKKRAKGIEKELPNCLRLMGIQLNIGLSFEQSLRSACNNSDLGSELKHVMRNIDNGSSVQEAFSALSNRIDSVFVKRAVAQIIASYEKGGAGETLKKLADEQESIIRARLKEYNGKMTVYSLLFIAVSAVFPAIFQAYMMVGSSFLNIGITPLQALLMPVLVFPLSNITLFLFVRWKSP